MAYDPLAGCRVLGFDLETTGLQSRTHRIIQFALVGSDEDGNAIRFESLVNPQRTIPSDSTRVHGITDDDVKDADTFQTFIDDLDALMEGAVIVGHNVKVFDWPFIGDEYLRSGRELPTPKAIVDTLQVARKLKVPRPHTLGALCHRFGIDLVNAHDAGADAAASLLLLWKLMEFDPAPFKRPLEDIQVWLSTTAGNNDELGPGYDDLEPFDADGKVRVGPDGLLIVFGKHRGRTLQEVIDMDPGYLDWMLSPNGPFDEVIRSKLRDRLSN